MSVSVASRSGYTGQGAMPVAEAVPDDWDDTDNLRRVPRRHPCGIRTRHTACTDRAQSSEYFTIGYTEGAQSITCIVYSGTP